MKYPIVTLAVSCLAILIANGQFNYGSRNVFGRGPPAFFPPQTPAAVGYPGLGGFGVCTPYPNYQSHGRNFWISWRGKQNSKYIQYIKKKIACFGHREQANIPL